MLIRSATFQTSAPSLAACPASTKPEFAFIGRSNVGKSSLINLLAGRKELARVSPTPGFTQLINFFSMDDAWTLVDLPGYGYAKTGKAERERFQQMIAEYLTGRPNLSRVFVLIDSRHEPQQIDLEFVEWLIEENVPWSLVFTKTDQAKPSQVQKNITLFEDRILLAGVDLPGTFTTSAKAKTGRSELLGYIKEMIG